MPGASPATATVTAKAGASVQSTAIALSGITSVSIDWRRMVIQFYVGNELTGPEKEFDLTGVTTFTITNPATTPAIVVS